MTISLIWAMGRNRIIGKNNSLPWDIPADLKHFKETTLGKTVVMGSKTYESLGRPLKGRRNMIITLVPLDAPGCEQVFSIPEALSKIDKDEEVFIIGGASIYKQFIPMADKLYITQIDHDFEGDISFPEFDMSEWRLVEKKKGQKDDRNPYDFWFTIYERKKK